ncbi:MAG TPA: phage portal protein, partial [Thermohalobaculum sp.]|nr:phage portal protein [Thermohalobaculum sp.]
ALAVVAPGVALRRARDRARWGALTGGFYDGGRSGRRGLRSWLPGGGSADRDLIPEIQDLRQDTRGLARTTPIARAALNRVATHVIGAGLHLQPQIDREFLALDDAAADAWEAAAAREFALWALSRNADATGHQTFFGLQDLVFRGVLESGDDFVVRRRIPRPDSPYGLAFQVFEADQVSNPQGKIEGRPLGNGNRLAGGVETDRNGRAVAYWFERDHPGSLTIGGQRLWSRVTAFGPGSGRLAVKHLFHRRRIGQSRGEPMLAPVIEPLKQLGRYTEAELFAAVIGAMVTVVYKSGSGGQLQNIDPDEAATSQGESDRDYEMAPGTVMEFFADDDIQVPSVGRPNSAFDPFFVAVVRQIGAGLEIPFEVLIQHFTASYSASRAALEAFWQVVRRQRAWFAEDFCQWAYGEFLVEAVALGRLEAPGFFADPALRQAWSGAEWIGPARLSIDPLKENQADAIAEDRGWKTAAEITREKTGGDWARKNKRRGREQALRIEAGVAASAPAAEPQTIPDDGDRPEDETEEAS